MRSGACIKEALLFENRPFSLIKREQVVSSRTSSRSLCTFVAWVHAARVASKMNVTTLSAVVARDRGDILTWSI